jgi:hypothetical protein
VQAAILEAGSRLLGAFGEASRGSGAENAQGLR